MDSRYQDIQARYLAEMRQLLPEVLAWWAANTERDPADLTSPTGNDFERRWPAGITAHPRVLHVFRKYFLEIDLLNMENEVRDTPPRPVDEDDWGTDDEDEANFQLPIDLLVDDLTQTAPDVYALVKGMVFVPIGLSPAEETC